MSQEKNFPWLILLIMSSVTFMGILSELVPSGILPQMSGGLDVSYAQIGLLVSVYAIASAVGTIPLITWTIEMNRKRLLLILMLIFGVSNLIIALTSSYYITAASRLAGGIAAGVLWPMVSAYAMRLVPPHLHGRAIAVTMSGSTFGLGIGLPIMTTIGTEFGWRTVFIVLSAVIFVIAILGKMYLPSVEGEKRTKTNSPFFIIRNKGVVVCLILTLLTIMAHYGLYTYIAPLVSYFNFYGGIKIASTLFGIGTIISVVIAGKVVDTHLGSLIIFKLTLALGTMLLFIVFQGMMFISHIAFLLWGVSFGALVTIFQAAVTKQVETGKDVATSLQSSTFNFGIVLGSALGGLILDNSSVFYIIFGTMALLVVPILLSISRKSIFS
ncbi:MFS transporter [Ruminiclostridium cellulolyticum]|uniref:Major facilitator superfamily MFS_1 n=1 Tax=Ruminiclostridium cellulolyticum (strain ATCC 35319 / DSM 5812 / JCM 6584 / H10) TaxID=394503 RepID=B8I8P7_RUMCH|nr:MFS transporter [Ruminiclostridium cellulolyticum]ACL75280.1 major facilitator superfamily MFS_1 [Ruminiclostridium cellulolyticum H10]